MNGLIEQVAECWPGVPGEEDESFWGPGGVFEQSYYAGLRSEPNAMTALLWVMAQGFWDAVDQRLDDAATNAMYEQWKEEGNQ